MLDSVAGKASRLLMKISSEFLHLVVLNRHDAHRRKRFAG